MVVTETFFSVDVCEMDRATAFYVQALGATVLFATPQWTSIKIAGVRIGLALSPAHKERRTGLHFSVDDLPAACAEVERAGGRLVMAPTEVAPDVVIAETSDRDGNTFTLKQN
jgi:predicted enzyme related to lactoylglutathione lyase